MPFNIFIVGMFTGLYGAVMGDTVYITIAFTLMLVSTLLAGFLE